MDGVRITRASSKKCLSKASARRALQRIVAARSRAYKIAKHQWVPSLPVIAEEEPEAEAPIDSEPERESEPEPEPELEPEEGFWSFCAIFIEGLWQEQTPTQAPSVGAEPTMEVI